MAGTTRMAIPGLRGEVGGGEGCDNTKLRCGLEVFRATGVYKILDILLDIYSLRQERSHWIIEFCVKITLTFNNSKCIFDTWY